MILLFVGGAVLAAGMATATAAGLGCLGLIKILHGLVRFIHQLVGKPGVILLALAELGPHQVGPMERELDQELRAVAPPNL